ncbi:sensor domain-containing diguanylate cyclase [Aquibacillus rhizosphaerae]|uniref:Sensor domain-containing diguanylate cyclase n=1 Tax=Aquibacillus rhizosphaerae TaxID=3051431 RepID=A0ABT7LB73_9BACI|nr:sensor domain-containing diguanylate cyclase [Aquibacillus sp. LR5S19]MDL4843119.1 sensor domain-containing diguanylate cyclase [Aquibacillus sp. LR5S19]
MNILFLSIIYLIPSSLYLFFAGIIYSNNRQSAKHKTCSVLFVVLSFWFLGMYTAYLIPGSLFDSIGLYWINASIQICALLTLHLWLLNTNKYKKKGFQIYSLLFIPGIVLLATTPFESWMIYKFDPIADPPIFIPGIGLYLTWFIGIVYLAINISLTIAEMKKGDQAAKLWLKGMLLFGVWSVTTTIVGLVFQQSSIGIMAYFIPHGTLFWSGAIFISMSKYDYLSSYEKRYQILFDRSPLGIMIMDINANIREASPLVATYLGVNRQDIINTSVLKYLNINEKTYTSQYNYAFKKQQKMINEEITFENKAGNKVIVTVDSEFVMVEGELLQFVMVKDITEAKRQDAQVQYLAYHDIMTGLPNRAAFQKQFDSLLERQNPFDFILLDLNKLKQINDNYGHQVGDQAIQFVADTLQDEVQEGNFIARLGGDEFVLLSSGIEETNKLITRIKQNLFSPLKIVYHMPLKISASFGISSYPIDGQEMDSLFKVADYRMYQEKNLQMEIPEQKSSSD